MDLSEFICPICSQFCRLAVQAQCCGHAFCNTCARQTQYKRIDCPSCQNFPFYFRQSKLGQRVIANMKIDCPNLECLQKIKKKDIQQHLLNCNYGDTICKICNERFKTKFIIQHMYDKHEQQTQKVMIDFHRSQSSKISSSSKIQNTSTHIDPLTKVVNRAGREAFLSKNGKFYCQGPLIVPCSCCDGNCGITDGQNCLGCMQLDVQTNSLPKGFLVNSRGLICKVDLHQKTVFCGAQSSNIGSLINFQCSKIKPCRWCKELTLQRYKSLLEDQ